MRWLLLKDLQIMRRSPLVTRALLVAYPIVIAVLIGFASSAAAPNRRGSRSSTRSRRAAAISRRRQEAAARPASSGRICKKVECVRVRKILPPWTYSLSRPSASTCSTPTS